MLYSEKYNIIYADCPWSYKDKASAGKRGAAYKYPTMTDDEIKALKISDIAADNCALFFWTTWPKLPVALEVIKSWGFVYKTVAFNWIKTNKKKNSTYFWGMGNYTRANSEICLLALKGKLKRKSAKVHQIISSPIEAHSKKPDCTRDKIVELFGDISKIELFARNESDNWDSLGNEIDGIDIVCSLQKVIDSLNNAK